MAKTSLPREPDLAIQDDREGGIWHTMEILDSMMPIYDEAPQNPQELAGRIREMDFWLHLKLSAEEQREFYDTVRAELAAVLNRTKGFETALRNIRWTLGNLLEVPDRGKHGMSVDERGDVRRGREYDYDKRYKASGSPPSDSAAGS